jgi:hypothetical protein
MARTIKLGEGLLYMKIGSHAQEPLEDIVARKTREIEQAGYALWGYGGNTCHPVSMVQPFARSYEERGGAIYLCMQPMESKHFAVPLRARQFSIDCVKWEDIPDSINVRGSRYALVIKDLQREEFDLSLARTKVAIGNSMGRPGHVYVAGKVDKACLEVTSEGVMQPDDGPTVHIGLVATLIKPHAVFVRG